MPPQILLACIRYGRLSGDQANDPAPAPPQPLETLDPAHDRPRNRNSVDIDQLCSFNGQLTDFGYAIRVLEAEAAIRAVSVSLDRLIIRLPQPPLTMATAPSEHCASGRYFT